MHQQVSKHRPTIGPIVAPSSKDPLAGIAKWLLVVHCITEEEYIKRKALFFKQYNDDQTAIPDDIPIPVSQVQDYLKDKYCGFSNVVFQADLSDTTTNQDIMLLQPPQYPAAPPDNILSFSLYFFNEMMTYFRDAAIIYVTKTISLIGTPGGNSIAFRLVDSESRLLYCADLSGVYP